MAKLIPRVVTAPTRWTLKQKTSNNRDASRKYKLDESQVRRWRKDELTQARRQCDADLKVVAST